MIKEQFFISDFSI